MYSDFIKIRSHSVARIVFQNPLEIYENLQRTKQSVLLIGNGDETNSQYSLIGNDPNLEVIFDGEHLWCNGNSITNNNPWEFLSILLEEFDLDNYSFPANLCGFVGYLSYEIARTLEQLPKTTIDSYRIPWLRMLLFQEYYIFDNYEKQAWKINFQFYEQKQNSITVDARSDCFVSGIVTENSEVEYVDKVKRIQKYITAGDVYEVNLTQQLAGKFEGNSLVLFRKLFNINDAPYSCYFDFDDFQIVSNSPELFLKASDKNVETRPIKGTIKRNDDNSIDGKNKQKLLSSEKDQAELYMIIDLLRNDLGKVSEIGSVYVDNPKKLEKYKNVYHLVGIVKSRLMQEKNYIDLLKAAFPGGSITGCPKIRSMEIIDELETYSRNIYTGTIFWMNSHFLNSNIIIRTVLIKDHEIFINSGGAITIDSNPQEEYEEMKTKIKNIMEVIGGTDADLS